MPTLEKCHTRLAPLLGPSAEPIEVLRRAEEHRAHWRPGRVRVLLLAESHVYTTAAELNRRIVHPSLAGSGVPRGFVRLVYCLGYGENRLLDVPIIAPRNTGTPQFWKIFYSCVNRVTSNGDFGPVLSSATNDTDTRLANKLALLRKLQGAGVWLLDTSVAALYTPGQPKPSPEVMWACLTTSWDSYVRDVVLAAAPQRIVCIGRGVASRLGDRLTGLGIPVTIVPQPNAHLTGEEHLAVFRQYYDLVQNPESDPTTPSE